ncbi:MAG: hypothetical protein NTY13_01090, partial [Chlamydiae bacterium]|nr:hypothetical protein [Chlamydiota bacterium]
FEWLAGVKAHFGNALLIAVEFLDGFQKVFRFFKDNWDASMNQHAEMLPLTKNINNLAWRPRFPLALKDEVPARAI